MRRASRQLPDRDKLFRLNHLCLNVFQVFEGMVRSLEQPRAVAVDKSLAHECERGNDEQGDLRHAYAKCSYGFAVRAVAKTPQGHNRDGDYGRHCDASRPPAPLLLLARNRIGRWLALICDDSRSSKPNK